MKDAEKRVKSTFSSFHSTLNLPSKKEVEELTKGIERISKQVDMLEK